MVGQLPRNAQAKKVKQELPAKVYPLPQKAKNKTNKAERKAVRNLRKKNHTVCATKALILSLPSCNVSTLPSMYEAIDVKDQRKICHNQCQNVSQKMTQDMSEGMSKDMSENMQEKSQEKNEKDMSEGIPKDMSKRRTKK